MFELLEHLPYPQKAIAEAQRVLKDNGLLALSVPFHYRLHGFPSDYWRFTASGVYTLLSTFPQKTVFAVGPRLKPAFIFAVATKTVSIRFDEKRKEFESQVAYAFRQSRLRGHLSIFKERAKDFWGHLLGRAEVSVVFFEPNMNGGYLSEKSSDDVRKQHEQTKKPE
jgi:SAM-dependent methyltransferase